MNGRCMRHKKLGTFRIPPCRSHSHITRSIVMFARIRFGRNREFKTTPNKNIVSQRLLADFSKSTNLYEKAAIMQALGNYEWNYKFIARFLTPLQDSLVQPALIQSACAEAWQRFAIAANLIGSWV